jgi:hypothetical protein
MATLATITDATYDLLYGTAQVERPRLDLLNGAITVGATTATFDTTTMWKQWDYAEAEADGEMIQFLEDHQAGATNILRAQPRGQTTAAQHDDNSVWYRNPKHPRYLIERLINEVIDNELGPHIWVRVNRKLTGGYIVGQTSYELAATDLEVEQVYQYDIGSTTKFYPIAHGLWDVDGSVHTDVSSTGRLLRIFRVHDSAEDVYYTVRSRPMSSDIASLSDQVANLVPWAVAGKAMAVTVGAKRGADARSPQVVSQSGDRPLRDATFFRAEFERMRADEELRLKLELMKSKQYKPRHRRVG